MLRSHIIGAHLYSATPHAALHFYSKVFQASSCVVCADHLHRPDVLPQMLSAPNNSLAISPVTIEGVDAADASTTVRGGYDRQQLKPRWVMKIATAAPISLTPILSSDDGLTFIGVAEDDAALSSLHASRLCAPFAEQPRTTGVVNWFDLAVRDGAAGEVAAALGALFGWRRTKSITFPGPNGLTHEYITALSPNGGLRNRDKLCGIVPVSVLLPNWRSGSQTCTVPFFAVPDLAALRRSCEVAAGLGGAVLSPEINADGMVSLLQDAEGLPFALYARNDIWEAVKESTVLHEEK